jgi:N-methylhydantoinase A
VPTLGVDVGGTFTDFAFWDGLGLRAGKTPTTPAQSVGVIEGAAEVVTGTAVERFLHGTTVATNAVLERTGARVALVTSPGMEDVLEIGRQDRPSLYDPMDDRPAPLVPRSRRFGVRGRMAPDGEELAPLAGLEEVIAAVTETEPEAVAVALLYSYANAAHEQRVSEALAAALDGVPVSRSSDVVPEFREFERTSTTVLNAYLVPLVGRYLRSLAERASGAGLPPTVLVMRSSGGLMALDAASRLPAAALLSGPAGGVVAAASVGAAAGAGRLISFDMGGTSTDVSRIEGGEPQLTYERYVAGYPCRLPAVAIHTVGAGGGSMAWMDAGGALRVGPKSAGADPGPACYGRGGRDATVTDAHVVLGRIAPTVALGRRLRIHPDLATAALERLGEGLGMTATEAALGVLSVADTVMERAIRKVSLEEGADPRDAVLVSFGGAGGLHATSLARRFDMAAVIVPPYAGVLSAIGLLLSPVRADAGRSLANPEPSTRRIHRAAGSVRAEASERLVGMGYEVDDLRTIVDVRYRGQAHETSVALEEGDDVAALAERFHRVHHDRNGFSRPEDPIEVVTVRAEALSESVISWEVVGWTPEIGDDARRGSRSIMTSAGEVEAAVVWRPALRTGDLFEGPAVVTEPEATTFVAAGERARVLDDGSLEVTW